MHECLANLSCDDAPLKRLSSGGPAGHCRFLGTMVWSCKMIASRSRNGKENQASSIVAKETRTRTPSG
jgi:hypothetical protein